MDDREIIEEYFSDPSVVNLIHEHIGLRYKIEFDMTKRIVTVRGEIGTKTWDIDLMLARLSHRIQ